MISQLLDHATSLRPNIPQDSMRFHEFPLGESTHFHQVPTKDTLVLPLSRLYSSDRTNCFAISSKSYLMAMHRYYRIGIPVRSRGDFLPSTLLFFIFYTPIIFFSTSFSLISSLISRPKPPRNIHRAHCRTLPLPHSHLTFSHFTLSNLTAFQLTPSNLLPSHLTLFHLTLSNLTPSQLTLFHLTPSHPTLPNFTSLTTSLQAHSFPPLPSTSLPPTSLPPPSFPPASLPPTSLPSTSLPPSLLPHSPPP